MDRENAKIVEERFGELVDENLDINVHHYERSGSFVVRGDNESLKKVAGFLMAIDGVFKYDGNLGKIRMSELYVENELLMHILHMG